MSQIDKTGTFRGRILDAGVAKTKNGFPQWTAQLQADEYYDEDTKQWVDWTSYEEKHISVYAVLFGSEGKSLLSYGQLQKALGWSGVSFSELATIDYSQAKIQFRVETNLYNDIVTLQVKWIDTYDAEPGRTIQKLDPVAIKELDAKYANGLRQASGGPKPKKVESVPVPTPAPVPAKVRKARTPKTEELVPPSPPKSVSSETCTKEQAWNSAYEAKDPSVDDNQISEIWLKTIETQGGEKAITFWGVIRDLVIEQVKQDDIPF